MTNYSFKCPRCTMGFQRAEKMPEHGRGRCGEPHCGLVFSVTTNKGGDSLPAKTTTMQAQLHRLHKLEI